MEDFNGYLDKKKRYIDCYCDTLFGCTECIFKSNSCCPRPDLSFKTEEQVDDAIKYMKEHDPIRYAGLRMAIENEPNVDKCVDKCVGSVDKNDNADMVNHPPHYEHGMEAIDEMILIFGVEATMNFCLLNAWKYRKRAIYKGTPEEDMKKSDWYIAKYKELRGNNYENNN